MTTKTNNAPGCNPIANAPQKTMAETINALAAECIAGWAGRIGEERAASVRALLDRVLPEYAAALGLTQDAVLAAIESCRNVNAINFYQEANFPSLADVAMFDTLAAFKAAYPSGKYVCPSCDGHSNNPYECDAGTVRDGKPCNWKSYGFFRTLGKGLRVVIKDKFLESPRVEEIFRPVEHAIIEPRLSREAA
jgi:hypothetical protein